MRERETETKSVRLRERKNVKERDSVRERDRQNVLK